MKKIIIAVCLWALVIGPTPASAQGVNITDFQAKILELTQKLNVLKSSPPPSLSAPWARIRQAPTELKVGEQGEWRVRVLRLASTTPLMLQASWGDEPSIGIMRLPPPGQTNQLIFLYNKYSEPGEYQIKFTALQGRQMDTVVTRVRVIP